MKTTHGFPPFEEMLDRIAPLIPTLYQALEKAVQEARGFFPADEESGLPVDPFLFPNLFRYYAKLHLDNAGHETEDLGRESLPNNGLLLRYAGLHLRILKASNGGVPPPGDSDMKQAYYMQHVLPFPLEEGMKPIEWNLLVLWDVTPGYLMKDLTLALPRTGRDSEVEVHWIGKIPHPILELRSEPAEQVPDDLEDISRRKHENTSDRTQD